MGSWEGGSVVLDFRMDTFLEVCRWGNYTRAAEQLNITQPAVTQHIQYLQHYYGVRLFIYRSKQLTLTPEGELLLRAARTMRHDEEKLKRDMLDLKAGRRSIRFGATLTIGEYLLPERVADYMARHPDTHIQMVVEDTKRLLRRLNEGELDFAVVEGYFHKSEYDFILWSHEPYICVCGADYPLPAGPLHLGELLDQVLLLRNDGSGTRDVLVKALEGMNHHLSDFRHITEISDLFVIKELVKRGRGITFLYRKAVERELADGSIRQVELADFRISHEFTFLWRKDSVFEEEFRQVFLELSGQ
ncbi:LysR family transcriptional regulator [uncultured Flavonifractor sp.]|uniref:LysR family transcriptional regulator n=1 Tax=uncultured Flavonifractor sp. TaxID=1193534 RepID=UPI0026246DA6|nr:LysR family transcriptional regulator [uncultured Flavonifractor sp.]